MKFDSPREVILYTVERAEVEDYVKDDAHHGIQYEVSYEGADSQLNGPICNLNVVVFKVYLPFDVMNLGHNVPCQFDCCQWSVGHLDLDILVDNRLLLVYHIGQTLGEKQEEPYYEEGHSGRINERLEAPY